MENPIKNTPVNPKHNSVNGIPTGNYTVPKGMGYTNMIKLALLNQGIPQTKENIEKAKTQFKAANKSGTVHVYKGANAKLQSTEYLWANDNVIIPKFNIK